jgi:protein-L-isoaspartate O-methyltransferase
MQVLVNALKVGGRLVVPVGSVAAPGVDEQKQVLWVVDKDEDGTVRGEKAMFVRFVPLVPL